MTNELLKRLCKIRRLARQSPEAGERKAAEATLLQLLQKHKVTEADLDRHEGPRIRVQARQRSAAQPFAGAAHFPGGITIEIVPGDPFGVVFGFGFGFSVHFGTAPPDP